MHIKKYHLIVLTALIVLLALIPSCGDDNDETPKGTATQSVETTEAVEPTTQPASTAPSQTPEETIKIGVVTSWSGTAAMVGTAFIDPLLDLTADQIEEMGGILGGRSIEFIKYDDQSSVARSVSGITRFADDDSVSVALFGGASATSILAAAEEAERLRMPFFTTYTGFPEEMELDYTVGVHGSEYGCYDVCMELAYEMADPKTIAFFGMEDRDAHTIKPRLVREAEARGIEVVYDELYDVGTMDFSPYLTKIKYADPDVLILSPVRAEGALAIYKQVGDLGGWGDTRVFSPHQLTASAKNIATAEGTVLWMAWIEGVQTPGAQAFEQAWMEKYGKAPFSDGLATLYAGIWTAIEAIELTGSTDREAIAKTAHSGDLTWDSPSGLVTVGIDGLGKYPGYFAQIHDGELVPLE